MEIIILGTILLLRVVQSITGKPCSKLAPRTALGMMSYMSLRMGMSAVTAVIALIVGGVTLADLKSLPSLGWIIAVATGVAITTSSICSMLAMHGASVVLSSLFGAAGLLVPTILGIFIFGQQVSLGQWVAIAGLFVSALLLASSSKTTNGKITWKTILLLFGSMLANGTTMLLQTLYKAYVPSGNVSIYSFLQFAIPAMVLLTVSMIWSKRTHESFPKIEKRLFGYTFFAAATWFGISQISTVASAFIPIAVLFPISDGGYTIISAIVAAIMFKEKLTIKSVCGVLIGVTALIMIKLLS